MPPFLTSADAAEKLRLKIGLQIGLTHAAYFNN